MTSVFVYVEVDQNRGWNASCMRYMNDSGGKGGGTLQKGWVVKWSLDLFGYQKVVDWKSRVATGEE